MTDRDQDLDDLLSALGHEAPSRVQMERWRRAMPTRPRRYAELAAAAILGFLLALGVLSTRTPDSGREPAGNFDPTATIEVIYDKGM